MHNVNFRLSPKKNVDGLIGVESHSGLPDLKDVSKLMKKIDRDFDLYYIYFYLSPEFAYQMFGFGTQSWVPNLPMKYLDSGLK